MNYCYTHAPNGWRARVLRSLAARRGAHQLVARIGRGDVLLGIAYT